MFIDEKYKLLFCHMPKTGGTSILNAVRSISGIGRYMEHGVDKHRPIRDAIIRYLAGVDIRDYTVFASVRNPWDLIHSDYYFCLRSHKNIDWIKKNFFNRSGQAENKWTKKLERAAAMDSFDEFVRIEYIDNHVSFWKSYCQDNDGNDLVNSVIRFEYIQLDWNRFCLAIGMPLNVLPVFNKTQSKPHYSEEYTPYTRSAVALLNVDMIERIGYEFT